MYDDVKEKWLSLCEQASHEQDPERLMNLIEQIERLLDDGELRPSEDRLRRAEEV